MNFIEELKWRGLLHQVAGDNVDEHINSGMRVGYCGFDPTADSLTIGNYLAIKMLMQWQRCGHKPVILMGGGTGLIGDPSGKDSERQLNSFETVAENISKQKAIFENLLDFDPALPNSAVLVNNYDWLKDISWIEALRDIGKYFSVNQMIQRDSVKDRLNNREQGISYTEFSYMLLQAYDYLHLHREYQCSVQLAGSDQYGNIVSGMDLIRRHNANNEDSTNVFGITNKLVTRSDGSKIGKTAGNAIWLSADKTSPYRFYQFWLNTTDEDVIKFLQWFTFLTQDEIKELEAKHQEAPHQRQAHKFLARYMTDMIHGEKATENAIAASEALFSNNGFDNIDEKTLEEVFDGVATASYDKSQLGSDELGVIQLLVDTGLAASNSRAREFLKNGAVSINGNKITTDHRLSSDDLLHGHTILLKRGKKTGPSHAGRTSYQHEYYSFHLAIQVRDLDEARDFYGTKLGFAEGRSSDSWIDFNMFGHQLVTHHNTDIGKAGKLPAIYNSVDNHGVPVPHFGVVLSMPDWQTLADKASTFIDHFIIEPYIRFPGQPGEQATFFFMDPTGNALEFKAFRNIEEQLFAK